MRAKFKCQQVNLLEFGEQVHFVPVQSGSAENKSFSQYTPSGKLELMITNTELYGAYKPGKEYYVDVTESNP